MLSASKVTSKKSYRVYRNGKEVRGEIWVAGNRWVVDDVPKCQSFARLVNNKVVDSVLISVKDNSTGFVEYQPVKKEGNMSEQKKSVSKIKESVLGTKDVGISAIQQGSKQAAARLVTDTIVSVIKKRVGDKWPTELDAPHIQPLVSFCVAAVTHLVCESMKGTVQGSEFLAQSSKYALIDCSSSLSKEYMSKLVSLIEEVAKEVNLPGVNDA